MKRIILPVSGIIAATGLLAAGLAGTANAAPVIDTDVMAANASTGYSVAAYWLASNGEALKAATQYYSFEETKKVSGTVKQGGGYNPDGKPGLTAPIGEEKVTAAKVKNINLPRTIGKVFFLDESGKQHWCSATSIQSKYKNLVSTAGQCVYDTDTNAPFKSWVFVPGYYQGKAPWGVYVGKQAYTHYDFSNYEDYDRDYAFVNVFDGIQIAGEEEVSGASYDTWSGDKYAKNVELTKDEYKALLDKYGPAYPLSVTTTSTSDNVGPDYPGAQVKAVEVTEATWKAAANHNSKANGSKWGWPKFTPLTETQYKQALLDKAAGKVLGKVIKTPKGNYALIQFFVKQWVKESSATKYWITKYYIQKVASVGRLGVNVGGQGFAWNQKTGLPVYSFGYPAAAHPDGNKPYTGVTPKWVYGKTSGKTFIVPSAKVEEQILLKGAVTGGFQGAPWLIKYSNAKRLGYVNGTTSLFYDADGNERIDYISSAYFDGETAAIYAKAANQWSGAIVSKEGAIFKG